MEPAGLVDFKVLLDVTGPRPACGVEIAVVATRSLLWEEESSCFSTTQVGLGPKVPPDQTDKSQGRIRTQ